ncbi:MAG: TolC family protein [Leptospira sp.]|nr:TolC family protein [Leptospira sp.]
MLIIYIKTAAWAFGFLLLFLVSHPVLARPKKVIEIDLEAAIQIAATNYFALKAMRNKNIAIKELITERWRDYLPSVGLVYIRQRYIIADGQDSISNEIRLNVEQVIYDGGKRGFDLDVARLEEILTREDFQITFNRVRLEVQKSFFAVLAAAGKVSLDKKSLERAKEQLRQSRLEQQHGFSTNVQVMSVASRLQEIELALLKSRNEYLRTKNDLKLVMTIDYDTDLKISGDLFRDFYLYRPAIDMDQLITRARSERPEILRAKINVHKLETEKEMAENAWIPKFSVGGYYGRMDEVFPLREPTWGVNMKLTFPLGNSTSNTTTSTGVRPNSLQATGIRNDNTNFNNSSNSTFQFADNLGYNRRVMEGKIKLGEGITEKNRLEQTIAIEVNKACDSTKESWDAIHIGNGQVYFRYESLRLMTTRYNVGEAKRSDILLAETEMVEAQEKLVDSMAKYMMSAYELEWVSGMKPDSLKMFKYSKGNGNSILLKILNDDFRKPKSGIHPIKIDERPNLDDFETEDKQENLIDKVKVDEN